MSPRTEEQFEQIRNTRRFAILEAALSVFADAGYHQASIAQIANKASISKGLIYNYFESKEDLLIAVLIQGVEGLKESFAMMEDELDTPEELKLFIQGSLSIMRRESNYYMLYFKVMMQAEVYSIVMSHYQEILGDLIDGVACYFKAKGDPHPQEKAMILASLLDGVGMHYIMSPERYDLALYEKIIFDLFK